MSQEAQPMRICRSSMFARWQRCWFIASYIIDAAACAAYFAAQRRADILFISAPG